MVTEAGTTTDVLYAGEVADLSTFIKDCAFSDKKAFLLAEGLPQQVVDQEKRQDLLYFIRWGKQDTNVSPASYTSGRIFTKQYELRWSRDQQTNSTRVVYLGEVDLPSAALGHGLEAHQGELTKLVKRDASKAIYLFGELLNDDRQRQLNLQKLDNGQVYYAEVRIPRLLLYPEPEPDTDPSQQPGNKQRIQLTVCEYVDKITGDVQLFRFQKIALAE